MAILHALLLCQPPVPMHSVQRFRQTTPTCVSKPKHLQSMPSRVAPTITHQCPPETLQDYAGAAALFVPISSVAVLYCCQEDSMPEDVKPMYAFSLFVYTAVVSMAMAIVGASL